MLGDPDLFTIEESKSFGVWPLNYLSAYAMIPYIKRMRGDLVGVEVGVLKGETSHVLLDTCPNIQRLYGVDFYKAHTDHDTVRPQESMDKYKEIAEKNLERFKDRYELMHMNSTDAAKKFDDNSVDFVLLDGDHTYTGIKTDLESWYPKVKSGGHIFIHDTFAQPVAQAIHDFKNEKRIRLPTLRSKNYIAFWVKP